MKEQITTNLLITDVKNKKKKTIIESLFRVINITAIAACIIYHFEAFPLTILLPISLITFIIITTIIMYNGHSVIHQIRCDNVEIYEDEVVKKVAINNKKHYLVFSNYHPHKEPGVIVSEKQYNECSLAQWDDNHYYIISVKTTNTNPYILVYPTKDYILSEDMAKKMV